MTEPSGTEKPSTDQEHRFDGVRFAPGVTSRSIAGRTVLYSRSDDRVVALDQIGTWTLGASGAREHLNDLVKELADAFDQPHESVERDLTALLKDLRDEGFLAAG